MDVGVILGSTFAAMVIVILSIGIAIFAVVYLRRRQHAKKVDLTRHVHVVLSCSHSSNINLCQWKDILFRNGHIS